MPYSINTKDGITINNIPDDVAPDAPELKARVAKERAARGASAEPAAPAIDSRSPAASSSLTAAPPAPPPEPVSSVPGKLWEMAKAAPGKLFVQAPQDIAQGLIDSGSGMVLGARQLAASAGLGDKEALAQQAAAREEELKRRNLIEKTASVGGDIATSLLPMGAVAKGVSMIPKVPGYLKTAASFLPSVSSGAIMDLLDPSKNYDAASKALKGATIGGATDVLARAPGAVYRKFASGGGEAAKEAASILNQAGLPRQTAATQVGSGMTQQLTDALGMTLVVGKKARENRDTNLDWITQLATEQAGMGPKGVGVTQITQAARNANAQRLDDAANMFRQGPDVPLPKVAPELQAALDKVESYLKATAQEGKAKPVQAAIAGATPPPSPFIMPPGVPPPPRPPVTITADEAMDRRRAASQLAHSEFSKVGGDETLARQFQKIRDSYDNAIKDTLPAAPVRPQIPLSHPAAPPGQPAISNADIPHTAEGFDKWKQQYAGHQDAVTAFEKGSEGGRLIPQNVYSVIEKSGGMKDIAPIMEAANLNIAKPPSGWNRAMMTGLLVGTPLGTGALGGLAGGDLSTGGAAGLVTAAAMIKALSHTPQTPAQREAFRKMLVAAGIGAGT